MKHRLLQNMFKIHELFFLNDVKKNCIPETQVVVSADAFTSRQKHNI